MSLHYAFASDQGPRPRQEDHLLSWPEIGLFGVADGIGGHGQGDEASRLAVRALDRIGKRHPRSIGSLQRAFALADRAIGLLEPMRFSAAHPGSTLSALWVGEGHALVAHLGDSSIFRIRQGQIERLTERHRNVWGYLTACLVGRGDHPQIGEVETQSQDLFLLASDGLDVLKDEEIVKLCARYPVPQLAEKLVQSALDAGTRDNVTVIAVGVP